jgi:hypothetical protein
MCDATHLTPDYAYLGADVDGWTIKATSMPNDFGGNVVTVTVAKSRRSRLTRRQSVRAMASLRLKYMDGGLVESHRSGNRDGLDVARRFVQVNRKGIDLMTELTEAKAMRAVGIDVNLLTAICGDHEQS